MESRKTILMHVSWEMTNPPTPDDNMPPELVSVPVEVWKKEPSGAVADWLSDKYGYLVDGWSLVS